MKVSGDARADVDDMTTTYKDGGVCSKSEETDQGYGVQAVDGLAERGRESWRRERE